jgi:hypothetical protein
MIMFVFIVELGIPDDGHYHWLRGLINPLFMEHRTKDLACNIHHILHFL